jgi:hypothetical protein
MKREMLRKLARRLRRLRHQEHYDQRVVAARSACGTRACLAGHAVMMVDRKLPLDRDSWSESEQPWDDVKILDRARVILGLTYVQADRLFTARPGYGEDCWPPEFAERWCATAQVPKPKHKERWPSRIAADLLDALADGKVEL